MLGSLPKYLSKLGSGETLSVDESMSAFEIVMSGNATPSQIGALLMGMRVRGETVDEIVGAVTAMRKKALVIEAPPEAVDTAGTGGDGSFLCVTNHALSTGGTWSNALATAADLSETSLEQALIDIAAFVDERGLKIALQAQRMIIPKELQFTAERIMRSPQRTGTADNDINAIYQMGMVPQGYHVNHFLADTDAWFLITDAPNGLKHFVRAPIKTAIEGDFDTGNVRFKARERYTFGWSDPRGIFGTPGAA